MLNFISSFYRLNRSILYLISAQFFLQLINSAFMQIFLIYMEKKGYADSVSGAFFSFRFLGVLISAAPLGLFIRKRRIKPILYMGALFTPFLSLIVLYTTERNYSSLIYISQFLWGVALACTQIAGLPYILRNSSEEKRVAAFSLSYATMSFGGIVSGLFIFTFSKLFPELFSELLALIIISIAGFFSLFFVFKMGNKESIPDESSQTRLTGKDISIIFRASLPNLIIATGAGLTVPFIGLFFYKIHGLDSDTFAMVSACTTIIVSYSFLIVPRLNETLGNRKAVLYSQSTAIALLVLLASTEFYHTLRFSLWIAIFCFIFRQPLMNLATPMTTDFTMKYVGHRNQEFLSAINAAIWSGSWFISSRIFVFFRKLDFDYGIIFLITASIYTVGVVWYFKLLTEHEKITSNKKKE